MKIELTRQRTQSDSDEDSAENAVYLEITKITRGQSQYFYEALYAFLNNSKENMRQWMDKKAEDQMHDELTSPEKAVMKELEVLIGKEINHSEMKSHAYGLLKQIQETIDRIRIY